MSGLVQMDQWDMMCCWATSNCPPKQQWGSHSQPQSAVFSSEGHTEARGVKIRDVLGLKEHWGAEQALCLYRKSRTLWGWLQGKN